MSTNCNITVSPIPVIHDSRGNLAVAQQGDFFSFAPDFVEWGMVPPVKIDGPAVFISLSRPDLAMITDDGGVITPDSSAPYIALSPSAAGGATDSLLCTKGCSLTTIEDCRIVKAPAIAEGRFTAPEGFPCRRIYYIYGTPAEAVRGGHSHITEHRLLIALQRAMSVMVTDSATTRRYRLSSPDEALYIPPGIWREIDSFTPGGVCLALSTTLYDPADYIRSSAQFASSKSI